MSEHARLGYSNKRWVNCAGSVQRELIYPDISSAAAIDGTGTHLLVEESLKVDSYNAVDFVGKIIGVGHEDMPNGWLVNEQRAERANVCLQYVTKRVSEMSHSGLTVEVLSEHRSFAGEIFGRDDYWGTCDISIIAKDGDKCVEIEIIDYKDGRGYVSEKNNSQLLSCLAGELNCVVHSSDVKCTVTIVQPKTTQMIRSESTTVDAVNEFIMLMETATAATDIDNAQMKKGDWCQWCKHKRNCSAQVDFESSGFSKLANEMSNVADMSSAKLAEFQTLKTVLFERFKAVEDEILLRLNSGNVVDGYVLGAGRTSRKWKVSDDDLAKILKNRRVKVSEYMISKIVSPAQLKKITSLTESQRDKILDECVETVEGKKTLKKVKTNSVDFGTVSFI